VTVAVSGTVITFSVAAPRTERFDRFLADQLSLSRTQAGRLIAEGRVAVNAAAPRASALLERGAVVSVEFPPEAPPREYAPAHLDLTFVYEDEHLAVLDKPAGLVVHPAPGHWNDTLVNALMGRGTPLAARGGEGRPGIVHRLDRDTSGLLLIAKTDAAHRRLGRAIQAREVERTYAAVTWGHWKKDEQRVEAAIARHPKDRKRMAVVATGRAAATRVRVVARFDLVDLIEARLESGRTHQIRVHAAHGGHPVVGDQVYGHGGSRRVTGAARPRAESIERLVSRQLLHAARLRFRHPATGEVIDVRSEWPVALRPALAECARARELLATPNPLQYLGFFASDG
jgi:23S rRNA pseudouridine1911/1915/1917 synthase